MLTLQLPDVPNAHALRLRTAVLRAPKTSDDAELVRELPLTEPEGKPDTLAEKEAVVGPGEGEGDGRAPGGATEAQFKNWEITVDLQAEEEELQV